MTPPAHACQRWNERRTVWRRPGDVFDAANHDVAAIGDRAARAFVETHHYSASMPASRLNVGLYEGAALVGVAVFSVPMGEAVLKKWTGYGLEAAAELGRFVLLDRVGYNGESWFLARALRCLAAQKPAMRGVVSFSDPQPRRSADGRTILRGHVGTIYQSSNALYAGRTRPRRLWLDAAGRVVSERALCKLRGDERGAGHVYERLVAAGAPRIRPGETGGAYVARALAQGPFVPLAHPGNHAYLLAVGGNLLRRHTRCEWETKFGRLVYPRSLDANASPEVPT